MIWVFAALFLIFSAGIIAAVLKVFGQLNQRLDAMSQSLQTANSAISSSLGNATNIFGTVQESLGKLSVSNQQIMEISKDISSLQELLRAPKLRGQIGEIFLENILAQVLPKEYFSIQYLSLSLASSTFTHGYFSSIVIFQFSQPPFSRIIVYIL